VSGLETCKVRAKNAEAALEDARKKQTEIQASVAELANQLRR
jgi:hypothetical protein